MTKEQLIIYLYDIYPEGGISFLVTVLTIIICSLIWFSWAVRKEDMPYDEIVEYYKEHTFEKEMKKTYPFLITWILVITVGYFIPSKNTFLAIVATPALVKSLEEKDGRLSNKSLNDK